MSSKFNGSKSYMKFSNDAVKLDSMPDYSNDMIKKVKMQHGNFVYNR